MRTLTLSARREYSGFCYRQGRPVKASGTWWREQWAVLARREGRLGRDEDGVIALYPAHGQRLLEIYL